MNLPTPAMNQPYRAILSGNQLVWLGESPQHSEAVEVYVTVAPSVTPKTPPNRGEKMAAILAQLAQTNPFKDVRDPVAWQRHQRQDRTLPERDA